jgi:hypothetical protein
VGGHAQTPNISGIGVLRLQVLIGTTVLQGGPYLWRRQRRVDCCAKLPDFVKSVTCTTGDLSFAKDFFQVATKFINPEIELVIVGQLMVFSLFLWVGLQTRFRGAS